MGATIKHTVRFDAVPDDATSAMSARGRQGLDGTLKAVEDMCLSAHPHFKSFIVLIAAHLTGGDSVLANSKNARQHIGSSLLGPTGGISHAAEPWW